MVLVLRVYDWLRIVYVSNEIALVDFYETVKNLLCLCNGREV